MTWQLYKRITGDSQRFGGDRVVPSLELFEPDIEVSPRLLAAGFSFAGVHAGVPRHRVEHDRDPKSPASAVKRATCTPGLNTKAFPSVSLTIVTVTTVIAGCVILMSVKVELLTMCPCLEIIPTLQGKVFRCRDCRLLHVGTIQHSTPFNAGASKCCRRFYTPIEV